MVGTMSDTTSEPRLVTVDVEGGELTLAEWGPQDATTAVLAIHGITASSRSWPLMAEELPDVRILAPDLRGRARSNGLPGPFGLRQHAADLGRVLDALGIDRAVAVGHSMGCFVAVELAANDRRVAELILIDGGFPLELPVGLRLEDAPSALLGPAFERLKMTFLTRVAYADYWRQHPAFAADWSSTVEGYLDYDLQESEGGFAPSSNPEAVLADFGDQFGPEWYVRDLGSIEAPITAIRAPRGLMDEEPGLYPPGRIESFRATLPDLRIVEVADVNHYTVLMSAHGASVVAEQLRDALDRVMTRAD